MIVLSHFQIAPLITAYHENRSAAFVSPDLGLTTSEVSLDAAGIHFDAQTLLTWDDARQIAKSDSGCFLLREGGIHKIQAFSEVTGRHASLYPTASAPTLLLGGFPMHRIKGTDPHRDTLAKIHAAQPVGFVLDTTTGLGYTAIEAARTADHVITIELDPAVVEVARLNPWSQALFEHPKIERRVGDSFEEVATFPDGSFTCIIHDPPTFSLAGDLYSGAYYRELYRILARGGRLFHYIGDLDSVSGQRVTAGVIRRLNEAGFARIVKHRQAFAVIAHKR